MKINNRIIVILGVAICSILIALAIITHFFILSTFEEIEKKQTTADMQRVLTMLNDDVEEVAAACSDLAGRDDTYQFVDRFGPGYFPSNPAEPTFLRTTGIDYILFYNSSGKLVYSRGYDPENGIMRDMPDGLDTIIRNSIIPGGFPEGISGRRGYSMLNGEPVILAGYHVTGSGHQEFPDGNLVMVRKINTDRLNEIAQQSNLDIIIRQVPGTKESAVFSEAEQKKMESGAILVTPVNNSVIEAAATITGIENTPTMLLVTVHSSRYLYHQVQVSIAYIAGAIIVLALMLVFVIRWPLKKYIVNPILLLDEKIKDIGKTGNPSLRVSVGGDDEIVSLATSLQLMLEEIHKAQQQTQESEAKFRTLAETSVAGIFVFRQKILYANRGAEIQTGYSRQELLTMDFRHFIHPDFKETIRNIVEKKLCGEDAANGTEFKIIRKDGEERWIESSATLFQYEGEQTLLSVRLDITDRKRVEEALRENEEKFRALVENTPDIVFSADLTGIFTYISPQYQRYGYFIHDLVGKPALDIVFPEDQNEFNENFIKTLREGCGQSTPFRILDKWQNVHWLEANFTVTLDHEGKRTGVQGMFRDITDRRKILDAITLANKKLNLMYDITRHDILNKVTILFGLIDMTRATASLREREQFLEEIRDAGQAIYRQIALTRDYQEVGIKSPRWNPMKEVICRTVSGFSCSGVHFTSDIDNLEIYADPLIEKVIYNLADNAVRYGRKITTISFSTQISDKGIALICEDDGIGIDAGVKEKIFERGFGNNTGLGLFLTREILMITGITIRETGEPGTGARFIISLPKGTYRFGEKMRIDSRVE